MQKGKQALLLHRGVCLRLCSTIFLPRRCLPPLTMHPPPPPTPPTPPTLTNFSPPLTLSPLFSFILHISVPFSDFLPRVKNIHLLRLHFIYFFFSPLLAHPHPRPRIPRLIFSTFPPSPSPSRHAPMPVWELQRLRLLCCGLGMGEVSALGPGGEAPVVFLLPPQIRDTGQGCAGLEGRTAGVLEASGG